MTDTRHLWELRCTKSIGKGQEDESDLEAFRAGGSGDGRFGGINDLVSIRPSDAHEGIYARFAVVRRARQTLRWR